MTDVPTAAKSVPSFEGSSWTGILAPMDTPYAETVNAAGPKIDHD